MCRRLRCKHCNCDVVGTKSDLKLSRARAVDQIKAIEKIRLSEFLMKILDNDSLNGFPLEPKHRHVLIDILEHEFHKTRIEKNDATDDSLLHSIEEIFNCGHD